MIVIDVGENRENIVITAVTPGGQVQAERACQSRKRPPIRLHPTRSTAGTRPERIDDSQSIPNNCFVNSTSQLYSLPTQLRSPKILINGQSGKTGS